ncbi:MAG: PQQ-binding-like beta-propeller repeat protein, partial [Planctomycetes bacterium]|nr:PQQ-binding-like beta-propeller repeat protein [Planctomycetota bacterium]
YFLDEGPIGIVDARLPEKWSLIARDAFNGRLLWKRRLEQWGWRFWEKDPQARLHPLEAVGVRGHVPDSNFHRMVVQGDRLIVTLGLKGPVSILDAATGKVIATAAGTARTDWIIASDGVAIALRPDESRPGRRVMTAIDVASGEVLWEKAVAKLDVSNLAAKHRRVFYAAQATLRCLDIRTGELEWSSRMETTSLVAWEDLLVAVSGRTFTTFTAKDGRKLCEVRAKGAGYICRGVMWYGPMAWKRPEMTGRKSPDAMAVGYDVRTGKKVGEAHARNLMAIGHHHRCYRNKASERYIISGKEGTEFLDLWKGEHSQNNWVRGPCIQGVVPAEGMLYAPPDQCFCEPGAKLPGFCALAAAAERRRAPVADEDRLERGPAYGTVADGTDAPAGSPDDWPTFRHDAARWGSTKTRVGIDLRRTWTSKLGGRLTAPVVSAGCVFVAAIDSHRLYALDAGDGHLLWSYVAGGRIDSPPTVYRGLVLFGCRDGYVYCLRRRDGREVWRFLAARYDRRIAAFDQLESAWPVHGSVLVRGGKVYFSAGRSTYLDGGIDLYALRPLTGEVVHRGHIEGPQASERFREDSFSVSGANSDVLVSEGGFIYMRQKKFAPDLREIQVPDADKLGAKRLGAHVFSTASLLDGSWYNRTYWMYSATWPGYQLAVQAPKAGQLLVVDRDETCALRVFYQRNRHSPFFFPATRGYLVFADKNSTEPQLVGEKGSRPPIAWLPEDSYTRRKLKAAALDKDKGIGYTRADPPVWTHWLKVRVRGMVKAGDHLFVAGPPDVFDANRPFACLSGKNDGVLVAMSAGDGKVLHEMRLDSSPVFDGLIAADGALYVSQENGNVTCLSEKR